ncbi:hypothetical protein ACFIOY_18820 [Bradyrhizobium sp. TZ2]
MRGLIDTRVPLLFAGIAYWLIGFSLSYVLDLKKGPWSPLVSGLAYRGVFNAAYGPLLLEVT